MLRGVHLARAIRSLMSVSGVGVALRMVVVSPKSDGECVDQVAAGSETAAAAGKVWIVTVQFLGDSYADSRECGEGYQ